MLQANRKSVMPAKAGIQCEGAKTQNLDSRLAGMTEGDVDFQSILLGPLGFEPRNV